jgi:hypothetical protein
MVAITPGCQGGLRQVFDFKISGMTQPAVLNVVPTLAQA